MKKIKLPGRKKPKPKKAKLINRTKPTRTWQLMRASLLEYRDNWLPYAKIVALIAVPSDLLALSASITANELTSAYVSIAALIMNMTVIWSVARRQKTGQVPAVTSAYYDGSAAFIRYLTVSFIMVLMIIPAAFGAALYETGQEAASAVSSTGPIQIIILAVALLVALPSLFLVVRYSVAPFALVDQGLRPLEALRLSRRLTTGRFWAVLGRFVMLILFLIAFTVPISIISIGISLLHAGNAAPVFFEICATILTLPIANIYIYRLYRNLADTLPAEDPSEASAEDVYLAETPA